MVRKYRFGTPFETGAVTAKVETAVQEFPGIISEAEGRLQFQWTLEETDRVYGLGENVRGINKRGWVYTSRCVDEPNHREDTKSLYSAHNFFVIEGKQHLGVFFDCPFAVTFDVGYTDTEIMMAEMAEKDFYVYLLEGECVRDIVKEFRQIIGRSYIPPKWAFGYQQSRWGYERESDIREVAEQHRTKHIPLDAVYLDIDYMESYKDFTIDQERFPDFEGLVREMKQKNIHLVPIIDAGVKIEDGYSVYEEGVKNGYFCKDINGREFTGGVWPGRVHFPDFLNPEVRSWFGNHYGMLMDKGIDGFWNDMNEPAIFYSQDRMEKVFAELGNCEKEHMDAHTFFEYLGKVNGLGGNPEDYKEFYHKTENGLMRHDRVHNLYGYQMTRAASEAFDRLAPEKRILMFSRSSYIGMHRFSGIWQGDNRSWWSHLLLNIKMMPSLNMCGFLYTGADIGGFGSDTTEDLLMRWLAFGIFTPLMRNHASAGTREQEVYQFKHWEDMKGLIEIRYGLIPYLYSEFMKCALEGEMMFMPLAFEYPDDDMAAAVEDQLFVGDSLMIAPVYEQNASGRYVYLPEDMVLVRMKSLGERSFCRMEKGYYYLKAELNEVIFFIRENHMLPLSEGGESVADISETKLEFIMAQGQEADYVLYRDNGYTKEFSKENETRIQVSAEGSLSLCGKPLLAELTMIE